jgi:hypothetical protein
MSYPKKKKGFRTINVEGQEFRWHFRPYFDTFIDRGVAGSIHEVISVRARCKGCYILKFAEEQSLLS